MTEEQKNRSNRLKYLLARAKEINEWREKALENLLVNIGPRIAKLGKKNYSGSGFHYGKVKSFGKLVDDLAISFQPCMNWLEKNEEEESLWLVREVIYNGLIEDIKEAEKLLTRE